MRLTTSEIHAIKAAAKLTFGQDAIVRVFGSRVDDARRGGDIDLHIETPRQIDPWRAKEAFLSRVFERIDEQRIDLITSVRGAERRPIEAIAYRDGIVL